jgi:hypothetical protein
VTCPLLLLSEPELPPRSCLECLLGGVRVLVGPPVFKLCFPSSARFVGICDLGASTTAARRRPPRSTGVAVAAAVGTLVGAWT